MEQLFTYSSLLVSEIKAVVAKDKEALDYLTFEALYDF